MLAIVQAGGEGSRMDVLTRERAKPALPVAGTHHLIDIALSNCVNSAISDVWLSVQYQSSSLDEHLRHGRPWDLDRHRGGLRVLAPESGRGAHVDGFTSGNAEDLWQLLDRIADTGADLVVVLSADHLFALDLRDVIAGHLEHDAECTVVTTQVTRSDARHKMVVDVEDGGAARVRSVAYKPDRAASGTIAAEIFVYSAHALADALHAVHRERGTDHLGDFGEHLVPRLVEAGRVHAVPLTSYWRDLGRPSAYLAAHRDLVRGRVDIFDRPGWPMTTYVDELEPARLRRGCLVEDSLVSPSCDIAGTVRGSVLGPGVVVEAGAVVEDAVLFADVHVRRGATVATSVLDEQVVVAARAEVGQARPRGRLTDEHLVLVGRASQVRSRAVLAPGARLEPGTIAD